MKYGLKIAALVAGLIATPAMSAIVGGGVTTGTGSFVELDGSGTFSVGLNNFDDTNLYAFNETQEIVLSEDLVLDLGLSPVMAGKKVSSHYVFFDPIDYVRQEGYVDFDGGILGVVTSTALLAASDALVSNDITYLSPTLRGLEGPDSVTIDGARLYVDWRASTPGDYVRVFTEVAVVPVPASGLLLMGGLLGFGALRRRR